MVAVVVVVLAVEVVRGVTVLGTGAMLATVWLVGAVVAGGSVGMLLITVSSISSSTEGLVAGSWELSSMRESSN